jgi:hypothetical protein
MFSGSDFDDIERAAVVVLIIVAILLVSIGFLIGHFV